MTSTLSQHRATSRLEEEGFLDVLAEGHTLGRKFDTSEDAHILSLVPEAGREVVFGYLHYQQLR